MIVVEVCDRHSAAIDAGSLFHHDAQSRSLGAHFLQGRPYRPPHPTARLVAARGTLRARDPVEVRVRDGVLSEKEAQLGRMFLDVAHIAELQLQIADGLPC